MTVTAEDLAILDRGEDPEPRIALRPDQSGMLDDVFVKGVTMFRAEMMDDQTLWLCCYLADPSEDHDRITFHVHVGGKRSRAPLEFGVGELPATPLRYERGGMSPP